MPNPYKLKQRLALASLPPAAGVVFSALAATWRTCEAGHAGLSTRVPQAAPHIYVTWHESILAMLGGYRGQKVHPFVSRSFDGELISRLSRVMGLAEVARGSSSKGGAQGLLELRAYLQAGEPVYITVDGPRGPRREAKEGSLKLAQLSGRTLVPIGFAARPVIRFRSWDRMMIPPPFSRGVFYFGPELRVPKAAKSLKPYVEALRTALNRCHEEAEGHVKGL